MGCAETGSDERLLPPGAVVGAYDDRADADRLRTRLTDLRARRSLGPASPFMVAQERLTHAKERIAKGTNAENALEYAFQGSAEEGERTVRFWCLPSEDLEHFRFPRVLSTVQRLSVAIAVIRDQRPGSSGYYVLLASPSLDNLYLR